MIQPDHKDLVLGLMGSTFGDLKKLDDSITSTSSTLGRRSDVVKQEMQKMVASVITQTVPTQPPQMQPIYVPQPQVQAPVHVAVTAVTPEPTNQMEFDFNRAARYEELIEVIEKLEKKIDQLSSKIDELNAPRKVSAPKPQKKKIDIPTPVKPTVEPVKNVVEDKKKVPGLLS